MTDPLAVAPEPPLTDAGREGRITIDPSEMPTIWEDPAGKGYPCFERPMTPKEAKATVEEYGRQICELEDKLAALATPDINQGRAE